MTQNIASIKYSNPLGKASALSLRFLLTYRYQLTALSSIYLKREASLGSMLKYLKYVN
jgi:hypothetical protein